MWIDRLFVSNTTQAIRVSARFAEERHKILAENVANIDTPDYHTQRLDVGSFKRTLGAALAEAKRTDADGLHLRGNAQVRTDRFGQLQVKPAIEPAANILFHDGSNARLESLMADLQENALRHRLSLNLLKGRFDGLLSAIRGRVQ